MSELVLRIGADAKNFDEELEKVRKQTTNLNEHLSTLTKVSAVAFAALTAEVGFSVAAFAQQEQATNALTQALQNQGIYTKELFADYRKQADALQTLTGIDDDAIVKGQALLQSYIGQTKISKDLTKAVLDLSVAKGIDLKAAFDLVGKAVSGNVGALSRHGIVLDENKTQSQQLAQFVELVSQRMGDQAAAANKGIGSLQLLRNTFGDLQEEIGARFAPLVELGIKRLTGLIASVRDNKPLIDLIVSMTAAGVVVSGLGLVVGGAGIAFLKLRAALLAAGVATSAMSIAVKGLIGATGIGLLVVMASEIYLNWSTVWPRMQAIFQAFTENVGAGASSIGKILSGLVTFDYAKIEEGWRELKEAFKKGYEEASEGLQSIDVAQAVTADEQKIIDTKRDFANRAERERQARESARIARQQAENELLRLETDKASKATIDLKKQEIEILKQLEDEKFSGDRSLLQKQREQNRLLLQEQHELDQVQRSEFEKEILTHNEEYQALTNEQKQAFLLKNQQDLEQQLLTKKNVQQQIAKEEATEQIKANNRFLVEQQKFGTAYATINRGMHSEVFQGTKSAFGDLAQLMQSSNATLKSIGKASAIANIIIKTAESAMNIYAGFSTIPIIGPALGVAGAAAAVAFGGEQVARVNAANQGGIVPGFGPDRDSTLSFLTPGELVVPRRSFDEVVDAVSASRSGRIGEGQASGSDAGIMNQVVGLLTQILNRVSQPVNQYVVNGDVLADDSFIDLLGRRLSDRVRDANLNLIAAELVEA